MSIDDLDFRRFIFLIRIDLGYDNKKDAIIYAYLGLPSIIIANERE